MSKNPDANDRLIFALDVPTVGQARELVNKLDGAVRFFKIGLELQMAGGLELARELIAEGKKVFLDCKFFDVEATVMRATAQVAGMGASFLTVHGSRQIMAAAVKGRGDSTLKILAVTVLTSMNEDDLKEFGYTDSIQDLVIQRALDAKAAGCDGIVASGREAAAIREAVGDEMVIVTPGIRPAGAETHEQKRAVTPAIAIGAGSDYLVVGRPIRDAENPKTAAEAIITEIREVV